MEKLNIPVAANNSDSVKEIQEPILYSDERKFRS
jgi:hypothetical protein